MSAPLLKTIYGILFLGCTAVLMSAKKSNIDTAKESKKKKRERVCKRGRSLFLLFQKAEWANNRRYVRIFPLKVRPHSPLDGRRMKFRRLFKNSQILSISLSFQTSTKTLVLCFGVARVIQEVLQSHTKIFHPIFVRIWRGFTENDYSGNIKLEQVVNSISI